MKGLDFASVMPDVVSDEEEVEEEDGDEEEEEDGDTAEESDEDEDER